MSEKTNSLLGSYLKDRRARLDPTALGFAAGRRRTPGLRREEVAQRANISPTWYTWLEQGRGGSPSTDVLNRIAAGLMMTEPEREHLFMLAFGHPPEVFYKRPSEITPRLQRLIDAMVTSPAIIKTATWDVVAWNRAAAIVLTDYSTLPPEDRNILKRIFCNSDIRAKQDGWGEVARFVLGAFRADATRAGAASEVTELVEELCQQSAEFAALWRDNDIGVYSEGTKRLLHPKLGRLELEYSGFAVDGRPDLGMIVYNPVLPSDADRIRRLVFAGAQSLPQNI
ncbi:helix-turn-helix domain protein [Ochrobactrum quorumnocens]|uniref:Helix-turn-helix domain protein n=1 Tax=Ochrobactrum quorumnocens TaxID=271865 RepID=A0A248UF59_9HYPH|nr:helix-turn-helix transcriptional regulator [[Ochrobactrum] quorumnocens]ASV85467.1 helix-turn-helix domain protein [[Ochrobactrum] quorumnocens]